MQGYSGAINSVDTETEYCTCDSCARVTGQMPDVRQHKPEPYVHPVSEGEYRMTLHFHSPSMHQAVNIYC